MTWLARRWTAWGRPATAGSRFRARPQPAHQRSDNATALTAATWTTHGVAHTAHSPGGGRIKHKEPTTRKDSVAALRPKGRVAALRSDRKSSVAGAPNRHARARRSERSPCSDLRVHDRSYWTFTMVRSKCSLSPEYAHRGLKQPKFQPEGERNAVAAPTPLHRGLKLKAHS